MAAAATELGIKAGVKPLTEEQERAINARRVAVALSAGAGCGKTFVLTERYLSELEPGVGALAPADLSQVVAITFTERAAREMRDRIRTKCLARVQHAPPEQGDYWLGMLRSLDSARISTIHSFCGSLLRSHAVEAELDPRFAVLEPAGAETLLSELIDDLLREKLTARDPSVLELIVTCGLPMVRAAMADLVDATRGRDFRRWLAMSPEQIVSAWSQFHRDFALPELLRQFAAEPAAAELMQLLQEHQFQNRKVAERCTALLKVLTGLPNSTQVGADLEAIHQCARVAGTKKQDWPNDGVYESFKCSAEVLRKKVDGLKRSATFEVAEAIPAARQGLALLGLIDELEQTYTRTKTELAVLDFDDLLLRARQLLVDPKHKALQERLAKDTRLLLVDECQDTDPIQVDLIKALCGQDLQNGKLFFVGDFKQSIYRFRGADPRVFRMLREETPEAGRLPLCRNFRSQPAILQFVNALFCDALDGGTTSEPNSSLRYEPLVADREQIYSGPAVEFMWCTAEQSVDGAAGESEATGQSQKDADGVESTSAEALRRREADWIARRIIQLLTVQPPSDPEALMIYDNGSPNPRGVRKGDIAILFRSLSDVSYYEDALRSYGIDYYLVGGHAFYAQQEIYDVLNLLRSLLSMADEVSLAGVLRSPFFSLTDETLFWLAQHEGGLSEGLRAAEFPAAIDGEQRCRAAFAARLIDELRAQKDRLPIAELINEVLARTGYDAALLGEFLGERKLANLRKLIAQARAFDRAGVMTLSDFVVQLSQFVVRQPREPLAATHPEATDVVRLMTIHQSKGLEFPVVFVPDLGRRSNDRSSTAEYSDELGPLVRLPKEDDHQKCVDGYALHAIVNSAEDQDELIRLFYVAATRAADFLVLSSGLKNLAATSSPWMGLLAKRFELATGRLLAHLPEGYAVPQIRVVTESPAIDARRHRGHVRVDLTKVIEEIERAAGESATPDASYVPPIPCDHSARLRFSISRLRSTLDETLVESDDFLHPSPTAIGADARAAIELGNLVHASLAGLNFDGHVDVAGQVALYGDKLRVVDDSIRGLARQLVEKFLNSSRAARLRNARQVFKEIEFLLVWPPESFDARQDNTREKVGRYLQGYIDCLYQDESGRWHVLDYKTNQVAEGGLTQLASAYEMQMLAYGLAAEQALGEPIADLVLHFMRTGDEHAFSWSDLARHRAIELVGQAIEIHLAAENGNVGKFGSPVELTLSQFIG